MLGILIPVQFGDNSKRSLNLGYNFQSQYLVPPDPINIFKAPFFTGFSRGGRALSGATGPDQSRLLVYNALESTWARRGRDGRQCILRAICDVAESPMAHNGLFGEIIDLIFTPHSEDDGDEDEDEQHLGRGGGGAAAAFHDARQAGLNGVDCQRTYSGCPPGEGFLDSISHFFD